MVAEKYVGTSMKGQWCWICINLSKWWFPSSLMPWHQIQKWTLGMMLICKQEHQRTKDANMLAWSFACMFTVFLRQVSNNYWYLDFCMCLKPGTWYVLHFLCKAIGSPICSCLRYKLHLMCSYTVCTSSTSYIKWDVTWNANDTCSFEKIFFWRLPTHK